VRYKWVMAGLSTLSAELEIEFLPAPGPTLDRVLAFALAPILEQRSRVVSERGNPS